MSTIEIRKTIPTTSNFYDTLSDTSDDDIIIQDTNPVVSGVKDVKILIHGVDSIDWQSKKSMIKIQRPKSANNQQVDNTDEPENIILDLNKIEETCRLKGYLEDGATYTAWKKVWMIRAMCTSGNINSEGARLNSLKIGDITFSSSNIQPHLEDLTWKFQSQDKEPQTAYTNVNNTNQDDIARIEVSIAIYFGDDRFAA
jgi:hypothetical protein